MKKRISDDVQIAIWDMIDKMEEDTDWLQIFSLTVKNGVQHILHHQEEPEFREECVLITNNPVEEKVYIILEPGL